MKGEDRITSYVCTNADETAKLPMAIIGKAKNPRCFRLGSPPVPYFSQDNALSDNKTFRKWFLDVFLSFVRKFTSRPCILLMDNCGPHRTDLIDVREQVELLPLPPNCTSIHQPMDLGIIAACKSLYRSFLLRKIVIDVKPRQARRDTPTAKRRMRGLSDGFDPHMLYVAQMVFDSWGEVATITIARCWRKSQVLPAHVAAEVNAVEGKMSRSLEDTDLVRDMVELLKKHSLYTLEDDSIREQLFQSTDEGDVENWLNNEEDIEIREALVEDALQIVKSGDAVMQAQNSSSCSSDEDEDDGVVSCLPAESIIRFHFKQIEDIAVESAVHDAVFHLQRAKAALLSAKRKERGGARRQLLITELL